VPNLYEILGVQIFAEQKDIKKAFKKLAVRYHPDKNPNNPEAEELFKQINQAYQILSDPTKKSLYDQTLMYGNIQPETASYQSYTPPYTATETVYKKEKPAHHLSNWQASIFALLIVIYMFFLVDSVTSFYSRVRYHQALGAYKNASYHEADELISSAVSADSSYARARYLKGLLALKFRYPQDAAHQFTQAIENSEVYHPEYYLKRGEAYQQLRNLGSVHLAVQDYQQVLKTEGDSIKIYDKMMRLYLQVGNFDSTRLAYEFLHRKTGFTDRNILWTLAREADYIDQLEKALTYYAEVISLNPNDFNPYVERAKIYATKLNDFTKACEDWQKAKSLNPEVRDDILEFFCEYEAENTL